MKYLLIIFITITIQANSTVDILFSQNAKGNLYLQDINVLCVDGFKFLLTFPKSKNSNVIQIFSDENKAVKCTNK